ncbi:DNA recombination and repair protein Rad51 C-terminal [Penicillium angulare]|uniref:DNA recombination and repair protein Rad51 C-terminal n=1 Tax=Penicillium angulare TaxID=116970 RepID=UPI00253FCF37|nr:DNA recombination and repair protein Rad51 C-terminal [Penicillium angulare]KAJ5291312.1 DNA recombination and repair protein Rad51 C-terminal [Penicillium angulare]
MDLLSVLPGFATKQFAHILPPLERAKISTVDLITLDTLEIAKRAHVPTADVRHLCARIVEALHSDLGFERTQRNIEPTGNDEANPNSNLDTEKTSLGPATRLQTSPWNIISTLDSTMDALLGGGIPTGYVTEVTGESGSGKTQFLLSLLLAVQLPKPHGIQKRAIYISTEHPLATNRLSQLIECHPYLSTLSVDQAPTLQNVLAINAMDLETQDHILNYQLPVAIKRYNAGLVIIDSVTSNYRAEHTNHSMLALSARSTELAKLGHMLRNLAAKEDIAILVANQVSDRFEPIDQASSDLSSKRPMFQNTPQGAASPLPRNRSGLPGPSTQQFPYDLPPSSAPSSSPFLTSQEEYFDGSYIIGNTARNEMMSLLHQERFFTGWGDGVYPRSSSLKTPALGFFWSTQIACRIALKKEIRSTFPAWDAGFPLSTPLEQMDPQENNHEGKALESRPGFTSALKTNTGEPETKPPTSNVEKSFVPDPVESASNPIRRVRSPAPPEPEVVTKRTMKVVFAPWTGGLEEEQIEGGVTSKSRRKVHEASFEIWKGGLRSINLSE